MDLLLYWILMEFIGRSVAQLAIPGPERPLCSRASPAEDFNWLGFRRDEGGLVVVAATLRTS